MKAIVLCLFILVIAACASKKNAQQHVDEKASETTVTDSQGLGQTIQDMVQNSKTLSLAQKKQLELLFTENKAKAEALSEQSFKFRAVLIKELFSPKVNHKAIKIIKADIKKIEALRLKNTFDTVDKVSSIVHDDPDHEMITERFMMMDRVR